MDRRRGGLENAGEVPRRPGSLGDLVGRERDERSRRMPLGGTNGVFPGTELRLRPRGPKPPAAHEVDLDSVAFAEGASLVDCGHRLAAYLDGRSEERRVGKECRSRW